MGHKNTTFAENNRLLSFNGFHLDISTPKVMGILNLTPDSFFDGGKHVDIANILKTCEEMLIDGAQIIDLGGVSTRPGAALVSEQEEWERVLPILKSLVVHFPGVWFSIDTYRSVIAEKCVEAGAMMINDISGGNLDPNMFATIARLRVPYVLMHMHGTPQSMQHHPLDIGLVDEVKDFFLNKVDDLRALGVEQIILDPGYGFGKTLEANYLLLKEQESLRIDNLPLLTGLSRKSMINKVLGTQAKDALNGTSVLNTLALLNGASILRVHDVKEAVECIRLVEQYQKAGS